MSKLVGMFQQTDGGWCEFGNCWNIDILRCDEILPNGLAVWSEYGLTVNQDGTSDLYYRCLRVADIGPAEFYENVYQLIDVFFDDELTALVESKWCADLLALRG